MSSEDDDHDSSMNENSAATNNDNDNESAVPSDIQLGSLAVEIALHPSSDVLAAGTMDGPVEIYSYSQKSNHHLMDFRHHKESCRAVQFSVCGSYLFSGSSDTTIQAIDLNAGTVTRRLTVQQGAAIYCLLSIGDYLLASGDDDGKLIVWDFRREVPILSLKPCAEYISSLAVRSDHKTLLATSGEGSISSFNLRSGKMENQSELFDNEFLNCALMKKDQKVICGASDGALNIFNFGEWGNISDRFPIGHNGSVDCILPISDDVLCAGCEDGLIRAVQIHPNNVIGVVGVHDSLPVEGLSLSHDGNLLASCSYDQKIKFHSFSGIKDVDIKPQNIKKPSKKKKPIKFQSKESDFFKDLV